MKNHFQNDRSRVKTKICDVDLPMVTHRHIGFHEFAHLIEQVWKTFLIPSLMSKMTLHGPRSLSRFGLMLGQRTTARSDMQVHTDSNE